MRRALLLGAAAAALVAVLLAARGPATTVAQTTLFVDDDGAQCPGAFSTIQAAVNAAAPGDTIHVCNGRYRESVDIQKSLILEGDVDTVVTTPGPVTSNTTIITVRNTTNVEIRNLVIGFPYDLAAQTPSGQPDLSVETNGPAAPGIQFRGIVYSNATGSVHDVNVARIRGAIDANGVPDPDMATQDSRSVVVAGGSSVEIFNLTTTDYGNVGITVTDSGTSARIESVQIEGFGNQLAESQLVVQRGIEVRNGASAVILGNGLENNWHTGAQTRVAADIALENAGLSQVGGGFTMGEINLIAEAQVGLFICGTNRFNHTIGFNFFTLNGQDQLNQATC
jgi:TusA-related sulfurtransferase